MFSILFISCNNRIKIEELQNVNSIYLDSIEYLNSTIKCYEDSIDKFKNSSDSLIDTLYYDLNNKNYIIDSLQDELFVAEFKLERIKEYNNIAAKGNNIKFLRGWINRVLSE